MRGWRRRDRGGGGAPLPRGADLASRVRGTSAPILVTRDGAVATVTINRPEARNAVNAAMWERLAEIFEELSADRGVRAVVLRGAGDRAFSAGADIKEFATKLGGQREARDYWRLVDAANTAVENCPKPVVAAIGGYVFGAAIALVAACDLRVAAARAELGVPAAKIGLTLGLNDTRRLVSAIGASHARDLLLTGRILSAQEALAIGLVNRVVPAEALDAETRRVTAAIERNAPLALRQAKANLNVVLRNPGLAGINEVEFSIAWAGSADFAEGVRAYVERRQPRFRGE